MAEMDWCRMRSLSTLVRTCSLTETLLRRRDDIQQENTDLQVLIFTTILCCSTVHLVCI